MRKALIVGIDHYDQISSLSGAVNDAHGVKAMLEHHADGTLNFAQPRLLAATGPGSRVTRAHLRTAVKELFEGDADIALFYFAGHGAIDSTGGFLCTSDCTGDGEGLLPLSDVLKFASDSRARNKVIILDSCHGGVAGSNEISTEYAALKEGLTILTASTAEQYALETGQGTGVFTSLLVDALNGAAANLIGDVTPGSVYAHIDQSLGPWDQRPVFKTNIKKFVSLRKANAAVELDNLKKVTLLFRDPAAPLQLDPTYEPDRSNKDANCLPQPDSARNADFAVLQALAKVNLVRPVGATHMYFAAMESKACELTALGQHYWRLVKRGLI